MNRLLLRLMFRLNQSRFWISFFFKKQGYHGLSRIWSRDGGQARCPLRPFQKNKIPKTTTLLYAYKSYVTNCLLTQSRRE
ncbi:hypothetical protein BGS_1202 [Beggiatoa sp. SS]|nr:hypothetical protein BGS_1202 [Beggiatoa sp. SS]